MSTQQAARRFIFGNGDSQGDGTAETGKQTRL